MWSRFYTINGEYRFPEEAYVGIFSRLGRNYTKGVDLGCGRGRHLPLLRQLCKSVDGLDLVNYQVAFDNFIECDIRQCGLDYGSYELAFSNGLFHHFEKIVASKLIAEIADDLRPGASLVFNLHSKSDYKYGAGREISEDCFICDQGVEKGQTHSFWSKADIEALLTGFDIVELFEGGRAGYSCWYAATLKR